MEILSTDKRFFETASVGDLRCLCSRCWQRIWRGTPIIVFSETWNFFYRYHPQCLDSEIVEDDEDIYEELAELKSLPEFKNFKQKSDRFLPFNWKKDTKGNLSIAIKKLCSQSRLLNDEDVRHLKKYLKHSMC